MERRWPDDFRVLPSHCIHPVTSRQHPTWHCTSIRSHIHPIPSHPIQSYPIRRWPADFARTRRSRLRQRREIEINFLYNHYLRVARYPVIMAPTGQTKFHYLQDCAGAKGLRACSESLTHPHHRFVCFNDGATSEREMLHGFANLRRLLSRHYPFCRAL